MRTSRCFFFFNDTATTEIYTLSLHDALPIFGDRLRYRDDVVVEGIGGQVRRVGRPPVPLPGVVLGVDESRSEEHTLNSSHANISYAVFCLKKKKHQPQALNVMIRF